MEIKIGKNAGFCYGVKRAVDGAKDVLESENKEVYCLGELVHNKDVLINLEEKGIKFIEQIDDARNLVIIRAHGVTKEIYEKAENNLLKIKDFTCPKVLIIHEIVEKYANDGFYIVLTGSKNHPENIGTSSYCGNNYSIIETPEELENLQKDIIMSKTKKVLLISQTTYSLKKFENIKNKITEYLRQDIELVIKNTICSATRIRQEETEKMAKEVDAMIIVGGKNSSNTKKLYDIAKKYCIKSICIENEKEIDSNLLNGVNKIGIMAGTSTPQSSIENITSYLKQNY